MTARGSASLITLLPEPAFDDDCLQDIELTIIDSERMWKLIKHYFLVKDVAAIAPEEFNGSDAEHPLKIQVKPTLLITKSLLLCSQYCTCSTA
jgi:hypothetical protein